MPNRQEIEIDGWKVRLSQQFGDTPAYKAEARDPLWGKYAEGFGNTAIEALTKVRDKTGVDLQELLASFGF